MNLGDQRTTIVGHGKMPPNRELHQGGRSSRGQNFYLHRLRIFSLLALFCFSFFQQAWAVMTGFCQGLNGIIVAAKEKIRIEGRIEANLQFAKEKKAYEKALQELQERSLE